MLSVPELAAVLGIIRAGVYELVGHYSAGLTLDTYTHTT